VGLNILISCLAELQLSSRYYRGALENYPTFREPAPPLRDGPGAAGTLSELQAILN